MRTVTVDGRIRDYYDTGNGEWADEWHCEPPPVGTKYIVIEADWTDDFSVRRIHEWRPYVAD